MFNYAFGDTEGRCRGRFPEIERRGHAFPPFAAVKRRGGLVVARRLGTLEGMSVAKERRAALTNCRLTDVGFEWREGGRLRESLEIEDGSGFFHHGREWTRTRVRAELSHWRRSFLPQLSEGRKFFLFFVLVIQRRGEAGRTKVVVADDGSVE